MQKNILRDAVALFDYLTCCRHAVIMYYRGDNVLSNKQLEQCRERAQYAKVFSANLKAARLRAGYSRKYMADCMGVSVTSYAFYEQSKNLPTTDNLVKLSQILHVSIDLLLDNVPDEYQRCRNMFARESVDFNDLDNDRIAVTVHHTDITQTLLMSKEDFVDLVHNAERRDREEIRNKFYRIFTDSYAYAANRRFSEQIKAEPLEYIDTP